MDSRIKEVLLRDIRSRVESKYENNYSGSLTQVNNELFNLYGNKKLEELVDALVDYFFQVIRPTAANIEFFYISLFKNIVEKKLNPNVLIKYFENDTFNTNAIQFESVFKLFLYTGSEIIFDKILETGGNYYPVKLSSFINAMMMKKYKNVMNKNYVVKKVSNIIKDTNKNYLDRILDTLSSNYDWDEIVETLPKPVFDAIKDNISNLSFAEQAELRNRSYLHKGFFNKLKDVENSFTIVGSPQGNHSLMTIKDQTERLYGYINGENKIIIPPKFDDISAIRKGFIYAYSKKDRGDIESGYYKFNEEGKILGYSKTNPNDMF